MSTATVWRKQTRGRRGDGASAAVLVIIAVGLPRTCWQRRCRPAAVWAATVRDRAASAASRAWAIRAWPLEFGWKSFGPTARSAGSAPSYASVASTTAVNPASRARSASRRRSAGSAGLPTPRDQHPDGRHAPRTALADRGAIDPREQLPPERPQQALVGLGPEPRLDPRRFEHVAVNRRVEPDPAPARCGAGARPSRGRRALPRRSPGRGRTPSRPGRSGSSAGRARAPARRSSAPRPRGPPRVSTARRGARSSLGSNPSPSFTAQPAAIESPARPTRTVPDGLASGYIAVAHPVGVGRPGDAPARVERRVGLEDELPHVGNLRGEAAVLDVNRLGVSREHAVGLPARRAELAAGVEDLFVVAALHPFVVARLGRSLRRASRNRACLPDAGPTGASPQARMAEVASK